MQQAEGLDVRWLDAAEAAARGGHAVAATVIAAGATSRPTAHIDPPRNVRAYALAMQAAGVELRERTAFTGLRTAPTADGGAGHGGGDGRRPHRDRARPADRRPVAPRRRPAGRPAHPGRRRPPHGRRPRAAARPSTSRACRWCSTSAPGCTGGSRRAACSSAGATPTSTPGEARAHRLAVLRADAGAAGGVRAASPGPGAAPDLGGDHRLHARPPADPRPGARRRTGRDRGSDGRLGRRPRDDVGPGRRARRRGPGRARPDRPHRRRRPRPRTASTRDGRSRLATDPIALPFPATSPGS